MRSQRKNKLLFLTRYSRIGASSRLRTYQYLPHLQAAGWKVIVAPLFNDRYLIELYSGERPSWINIITCYFRRLACLFKIRQYDGIVIEKELFPFLPSWAEWWISRIGKGYVVDYDDAVFHNYNLHRSIWVRSMLSGKVEKVMRYSRKVLVGNEYLGDKASSVGAVNVKFIPTVVDGARYFPVYDKIPVDLVKVGWIGSPTTLKYIKNILPILEKLNDRCPFELVIIGGEGRIGFSGKETTVTWSEKSEVSEIQNLDIGIMPLADTPWELGKCGYKLIQYMACGLPVVGSPVGVNTTLISNNLNGYLAANEGEWDKCLERLILDKDLRVQMGKEGVRLVNEHYTLQKFFPVYLNALKE